MHRPTLLVVALVIASLFACDDADDGGEGEGEEGEGEEGEGEEGEGEEGEGEEGEGEAGEGEGEPVGGPCATDADCESGICDDEFLLQCLANECPCDEGLVCEDFGCARLCVPPGGLGAVCLETYDDTQCIVRLECEEGLACTAVGSPGESTERSRCLVSTDGACTTNADCAEGFCEGGTCVSPPCNPDGTCSNAGDVCVRATTCRQFCAAPAPVGEICEVTPGFGGDTCQLLWTCEAGLVCDLEGGELRRCLLP